MSAVPSPATKKRKKTDAKPQSQINKCLNEKRRREQENIYIEELAELISASFADMNSLSVKPDKCAILQETVNQIRHIKQQEHCGGDAAVQQGEVSSSNPTVLRNEVFGPLLLEALDGFLFVVNREGKIVFVTENVHEFIKFTRDEVDDKSIYNFIHHGDHGRFSSSLLPMSLGWNTEPNTQNRKTFDCRLLVKPPDDQDTTMEEKQQRISKYENMQIQCTPVQLNADKGDGDDVTSESTDVNLSLMCVARRIPQNEKSIGTPIEQFSMKLETSGKIVGIDASGVSVAYSQYLNKDLLGHIIHEMCHPLDLQKLTMHLKETLTMGTSTSSLYRLRVGSPDKFVRVKTVSKLFKTNASLQEPDFIMATHSLIGEQDISSSDVVTSPPSTTSVGGPLMSGSNGGVSLPAGSVGSGNHQQPPQQSFSSYDLSIQEFDFFPSSTWDISEGADSRASLTPRPPSVPVYTSPAHAFPFSPLQEEEKEVREEPQESGRLRNLLTQRSSFDEDDNEARNKHRILKGLLNQEEDEEGGRTANSRLTSSQTPPSINNNNNNNNMLLKLLNDKSDDDGVESRIGMKKQHELLHRLLKDKSEDMIPNVSGNSQEDALLKSLGFPNQTPSPPAADAISLLIGNRKRPSDEADGNVGPGGKRPPDSGSSGQVTSTGGSKLWERNKMLASLLAKDPPRSTIIPPIPTSVISATPQDKLPKIGERLKTPVGSPWSGGNIQPSGSQSRPTGPPNIGKPQRQPSNQFLSIAQHQQDVQGMQVKALQERGHNNINQMWESQQSDSILSDLLDQVIDIVPEVSVDQNQMLSLLDEIDQSQPPNQTCFQQDQLQERMAINAIQKSLMQCETAVKSPSSPGSYNPQSVQPSGFPPPPVYHIPRPRFGGARQQFPVATQQQALMQRKILQEQKQQKQRLLQAQQQQQLLIPSNAAADPATLSNIDSLLNNAVAPNVTLQRASSVNDSQLSPGYSNQLLNNGGTQISSPRQAQPYSPHSPQGWGQTHQARLSPQTQNQLSPRITQGQQPGYPVSSQGPSSWQPQNRLSLQQQQNPMLNAQLTGNYGNGAGRFPTQARVGQPGRTLASPGPGPRQSPFTPEAFPPPASPTGYQPSQQFQQQQQLRIQRSVSTPTATTQLPGGHYGLGKEIPRSHHLSYPSPEHMLYHHTLPPDMQYYEPLYPRTSQLQSAATYVGGRGWHSQNARRQQPISQPRIFGVPAMVKKDMRSLENINTKKSPTFSDFVRQELRAVVGARTQQAGGHPSSPRQHIQQVSAADLEALGLSFEMPSGPSESPKMWGSELGASSPQPGHSNRGTTSMEETQRVGEQKSSLLQKLLSE